MVIATWNFAPAGYMREPSVLGVSTAICPEPPDPVDVSVDAHVKAGFAAALATEAGIAASSVPPPQAASARTRGDSKVAFLLFIGSSEVGRRRARGSVVFACRESAIRRMAADTTFDKRELHAIARNAM
ncbi:hypothetical protein [Caballeronia sp. LZ016]|uniref:hypothetical protein n=1 Tax=Caballeronia sp. LZ016 TaxID=3038554 RepID=UPI002861F66D|nr:hypothetical protein [Caballeronia sp. LZ016]MDR5738371.1 hypothetical protein [Caballeronia sp. LZ016]